MADFEISTKYNGPQVDGQIDALLLSNALRSLAMFVDHATTYAVGPEASVTAKVTALKRSSFDFTLAFDLLKEGSALTASLFPVLGSPSDIGRIAALIRDSLAILNHLGGSKPAKTFTADHGSVAIENSSGVVQVFNIDSANFILAPGNSGLTQDFIGRPISTEAESVDVRFNGEPIATVSRKDARAFSEVSSDTLEHRSRSDVVLRILKPALEGHAQWRFHDGASSFDARIEDEVFLKRVNDGEKFGRGDHLLVRLRSEQYRTQRGALRVKRYVESVIDRAHFSEPIQTAFEP